jgi:hypothetical protein
MAQTHFSHGEETLSFGGGDHVATFEKDKLRVRQGTRPPDEVWYHRYHVSWTRRRGLQGSAMSRSTQPKDPDQEAHNRGGLEIIIR